MKKQPTVTPKTVKKAPTVQSVVRSKPEGGIIPKPSRTEIVEALVLAKATEHRDRCATFAAEGAALKENYEKLLLAAVRSTPSLVLDTIKTSDRYASGNEITLIAGVKISALPAETQKAYRALETWEKNRHQNQPPQFNWDRVRAEMRLALAADPARVAVLAKSPEIAATLAHIEKHKPKPVLTLMC